MLKIQTGGITGHLRSALVSSALMSLLALVGALFARYVYDSILPAGEASTHSLIWMSFGALIAVLMGAILGVTRSIITEDAGRICDKENADDLYNKIVDTSLDKQPAQHISSSAFAQLDSIRDAHISGLSSAYADIAFTAIFLALTAYLGGWLVMVPVICGAIILTVSLMVSWEINNISQETADTLAKRQSRLTETVFGIDDIKLLGAEDSFKKQMNALNEDYSDSNAKLRLLGGFAMEASRSAGMLAQLLAISFGTISVFSGSITMGGLIAVSILSGQTIRPMVVLGSLLIKKGRAKASERCLSAIYDLQEVQSKGKMEIDHCDGSMELKDVSYSYPKSKVASLKDISLKIEAGEKIGLVGTTGSGKSTLSKILAGEISDQGITLIGGNDVGIYKRSSLKKIIGVLPQNPVLFTGTLKENISIGKPEATDAEINKACQVAGIADLINKHPDGYEMYIAEGGKNLSGGQRQLIALARLVIMDQQIVFLDEPTAHLDCENEAVVVKNLGEWLENRTAIIASHRGLPLNLTSKIIRMEEGKIKAIQEVQKQNHLRSVA